MGGGAGGRSTGSPRAPWYGGSSDGPDGRHREGWWRVRAPPPAGRRRPAGVGGGGCVRCDSTGHAAGRGVGCRRTRWGGLPERRSGGFRNWRGELPRRDGATDGATAEEASRGSGFGEVGSAPGCTSHASHPFRRFVVPWLGHGHMQQVYTSDGTTSHTSPSPCPADHEVSKNRFRVEPRRPAGAGSRASTVNGRSGRTKSLLKAAARRP